MTVKIAGIDFDQVSYYEEGDVLYLHVGDPSTAVDWDESEEGDGVRYGTNGELVGLTILNAKRRLTRDGELSITLPQQRVVAGATTFRDAFAVHA